MKYYLIAGEASGDLHASHLMHSLKEVDKDAEFRFFGGDLMQAQGGTLVKHYKEMAFMGFIPVLMNLRTIMSNMKFCKQDIQAFDPDKIIFIDYPGFNLKIAKFLKEEYVSKTGKKPTNIYYISPKIWAWKTYRIHSIKKYIDKMLCILPFEVEFYKKHDFAIDYVGNPTVDEVRDFQSKPIQTIASDKPIIALLAGSRKQEIKDNLPVMLEAARPFSDYQLIIAGAPGIEPDYYNQFIDNQSVEIVFGQTYALLSQAHAALVTSGTATLETALFRVPQAVCYKTPIPHIASYAFKHFFSCDYISLVNLIADKTLVKELFGKYFSVKQIHDELHKILYDKEYYSTMQSDYDKVIQILGNTNAAQQAAQVIVSGI